MAVDVSMVKPREGVMAVSFTPSTRTIFHPYVASPTTIPGAAQGQAALSGLGASIAGERSQQGLASDQVLGHHC
jgi:hypothetical protein